MNPDSSPRGNPFAETDTATRGALPDGAAVLRQPYAAPAGLANGTAPESAAALQAGPVGVFRDGEFVVLHQAAALPPLCIGCGRLTRARSQLPVDWSPLANEWQVSRTLAAHLCPACGRRQRQGELRLAAALAVILGVVLALAAGRERLANSPLLRGLAGLGGAAAIGLALAMAQRSAPQRWRYVRSRGPYVWLEGPPPALLAILPDFSSACGGKHSS